MNRLTISALAVAISLASSAEAAVEDLRDSQTYTGTDVTTAAPSETTMETNSSAMRESQTYSGTSAEGPANADAMPTTNKAGKGCDKMQVDQKVGADCTSTTK